MTDYTPDKKKQWHWIKCSSGQFMELRDMASEQILFIYSGGKFPTEANAEIIASAPRLKEERDELLEALIGIMELHRLTQSHNVNTEWRETIVKKANAIIAKVEK